MFRDEEVTIRDVDDRLLQDMSSKRVILNHRIPVIKGVHRKDPFP